MLACRDITSSVLCVTVLLWFCSTSISLGFVHRPFDFALVVVFIIDEHHSIYTHFKTQVTPQAVTVPLVSLEVDARYQH